MTNKEWAIKNKIPQRITLVKNALMKELKPLIKAYNFQVKIESSKISYSKYIYIFNKYEPIFYIRISDHSGTGSGDIHNYGIKGYPIDVTAVTTDYLEISEVEYQDTLDEIYKMIEKILMRLS